MKNIFKSSLSVMAAAVFATACVAPATLAASKVSFNTGTNGSYGNEADFLQLSADDKTFTNDLTVENGKEYVVRMYIHNNSGDNGPASVNAKAVVNGLNNSGETVTVTGKISADNANTVTDTANFVAGQNTKIKSLTYVEGTAQYYTGYNGGTTFKLGSNLFSTGALLGYSALDGSIPSCYQYSGWLTFHVLAATESTSTQNPNFTIEKTVQIYTTDDNKNFNGDDKITEAKAGDILRYAIHFKNTGDTNLTEVTIRDELPPYLEYVAGSTIAKAGSNTEYVSIADGITTQGITLSKLNFAPNGGAWIMFKVKVTADIDQKCGNKNLINTVKANANYTDASGTKKEVGTKKDTSDVYVAGETCEEDPTPEPTPEVLPETGATGIAAGALGAGAMVTTAGYFIASRKQLKK